MLGQMELIYNMKNKLILIPAALLSLLSFSCNQEKDSPKFTKQDAVVQSHLCIEKLLKSPGSTEFPYQPDETIDQLNDSTFVVLSYVDSENDFGGLKRTYYKCKVIANKVGEARCEDMKLEEKN